MRTDLELRDFARKLDKKLIHESANVSAAVVGERLLWWSRGPHLISGQSNMRDSECESA